MKHLDFQQINLNQRYLVVHKNGVTLGDLCKLEDGFYYWWPDNTRTGCYESYVIREIADKLDELNKPWSNEIDEYFAKDGPTSTIAADFPRFADY